MEIEHANFQVDISISDKHIAQIAVSVDDVFFKTAIWSIYRHRTEVEIEFVEYWDQTGSKVCISYFKKSIWKLTLFYPVLTWPCSVVD